MSAQTCHHHPEAKTSRHCAVCGLPYCQACLEVLPGAGFVCVSCEPELEGMSPELRKQALVSVREKVREHLPPPPIAWTRELLFWSLVLLPSVLGMGVLAELQQLRLWLAWAQEEPRLPGKTTAQLQHVATLLERARTQAGSYPASLETLVQETERSLLRDPYGMADETLVYQVQGPTYRLCSRGPDRRSTPMQPLDWMSGRGDLCVGRLE